MLIKNLTTDNIFVDVSNSRKVIVGKQGINIPASIDDYPLSDMMSIYPEFQALVSQNKIQIKAYDNADYGFVSQGEFSAINNGVYSSSITNSPGAATISPVQASIESVLGPFSLRDKNYLQFTVDNKHVIMVEFVRRPDAYPASEIVVILNNHVEFSKHMIASEDNPGKVTVKSKSYGAFAKLDVSTTIQLNSQDIFQFATLPAVGTGTASVFHVKVMNCTNLPMANAKVEVKVYDAAAAGALIPTSIVQTLTKGGFISGLYTNSAVLTSDVNGDIQFEVTDLAGAADTLYVSVEKPTGYFLAVAPADTARVSVAIA